MSTGMYSIGPLSERMQCWNVKTALTPTLIEDAAARDSRVRYINAVIYFFFQPSQKPSGYCRIKRLDISAFSSLCLSSSLPHSHSLSLALCLSLFVALGSAFIRVEHTGNSPCREQLVITDCTCCDGSLRYQKMGGQSLACWHLFAVATLFHCTENNAQPDFWAYDGKKYIWTNFENLLSFVTDIFCCCLWSNYTIKS